MLQYLKNRISFYLHFLKWGFYYPVPVTKRLSIMVDYYNLYKRKGLTMDEYFDFGFETRDVKFRDSFLGLNEQRAYLEVLNPVKYYSFARNKYAAHKFFENTGIRTSELYCYYDPFGVVFGSCEIASDYHDVVRILKTKNVQRCVIKATEDSHGDNVIVVTSIKYSENDCELEFFNGTSDKLSNVLSNQPRIFESLINQTQQFSDFNESSVNTVRFMTTLYPDNSAKVIATFIKIGRAGRCVDNAGGGGNVDVSIDVETGMIQYPIQYDGWRNTKDIEKHPDSGSQLRGVIVDNWDAIKAEVIKFQQAFPWCKAAGWDIAITDEGPVVIEVNDMWDRTGQFFIRRGWRNEIRDCYLAWKKVGYDFGMVRSVKTLSDKHIKRIINH